MQKRLAPSRNKYGLSRTIPAAVKRQVRQECCFGCVICGQLPYEYEHFSPPFAQARLHDPEVIALLCTACHREKTAGRLSASVVADKRQDPFNRNLDAVWTSRLFTSSGPLVRFCSNTVGAQRRVVALLINSTVVFAASREVGSGALLLEGAFCDNFGRASLRFADNEVLVGKGMWDCTLEGQKLTVRARHREPVAIVNFDGATGIVSIERLRMQLGNGTTIEGDSEQLKVNDRQLFSSSTISNNTKISPQDETKFFNIQDPKLGDWTDWVKHTS